jgi:methylmalonyl-CoA/ethylmalonyl-CoA epimerase
MLNRLNHVAIAVPDLVSATAFYRDVLRAQVSEPIDLVEHGVTTVFVTLANTKLELITPLGDNSPIKRYLQKNPRGGLHHLCFDVKDIEESANNLKNTQVRILKEPHSGAHGLPVVFLHPGDTFGCLLELEESS